MLNKSEMQILTKTIKPPPPIPWMPLAAISILILTLTAHNRLPIKNIPAATKSMGLRPQMSLIFPHDGVLAALARRYAEPIHV